MEKKTNMVYLLGTAIVPLLAMTANSLSALVFALVFVILTVLSRLILFPLTKKADDSSKFALTLIVVVGLVSLFKMILEAYLPSLYSETFGLYLSLASITGMELYILNSSKLTIKASLLSALKLSLLFSLILLLTAIVREVFGSSAIFGLKLTFIKEALLPLFGKASGAFFAFAFVLALMKKLSKEEK